MLVLPTNRRTGILLTVVNNSTSGGL